MHKAFQDFLTHLRLTRKSPLTVRRYTDILAELGRCTDDAPPDTLNKTSLLRFAGAPSTKGRLRTPAGFNLRIAVLRAAFRYLLNEGLVPTNPAASLTRVREPRKVPKFLTTAETVRLLQHVSERPSINRLRDLAIVVTFWLTALRVSELSRLRWEHLDVDRRAFCGVVIKGGHVVDVELNDEVIAILVGFRLQSAQSKETDPIFATDAGRALSDRGIQARFEMWRAELDWKRPLHPHVLRHTHATGALALGTDIATVADLLRHHGLGTVMAYATVQDGPRRVALGKLGRLVPREILKCYAANDEAMKPQEETACVESPFYEPGEAA